MLAGSIGCILLGCFFRCSGSAARYANVELTLKGRSTQVRALVDTGNSLTDRNNTGVIVADWQVLRELLPEFTAGDAAMPGSGFQKWSARLGAKRVRLLSYRTVGTPDGLLLAVRPEKVTVDGIKRAGLLVAASAHPVSEAGAYHALIGAEETGGMV